MEKFWKALCQTLIPSVWRSKRDQQTAKIASLRTSLETLCATVIYKPLPEFYNDVWKDVLDDNSDTPNTRDEDQFITLLYAFCAGKDSIIDNNY